MEETRCCLVCKVEKTLKSFAEGGNGGRRNICERCRSAKRSAKLKLEMLEAFGWKCVCCGEDNPQFLSIDHINNDGLAHRREIGSFSQETMINAIKSEGWPKDKYQLLCMNCNTAKGWYGECPHKRGLTTEKVIEELKSRIYHIAKEHFAAAKTSTIAKRSISKLLDNLTSEQAVKLLGRLKSGTYQNIKTR